MPGDYSSRIKWKLEKSSKHRVVHLDGVPRGRLFKSPQPKTWNCRYRKPNGVVCNFDSVGKMNDAKAKIEAAIIEEYDVK